MAVDTNCIEEVATKAAKCFDVSHLDESGFAPRSKTVRHDGGKAKDVLHLAQKNNDVEHPGNPGSTVLFWAKHHGPLDTSEP
jgi:hypothetical protein